MKKKIFTTIMAALTISMMAQTTIEPGYYRIKNKGEAGRYITIRNDKVEKRASEVEITQGASGEITIWSLQTVKNPLTDPGSVLYISGDKSNLSLEGQGMKTTELLKKYKLQSQGSSLFSEVTKSGVSVIAIMADNYEANVNNDAEIRIIYGSKVTNLYGQYKSWDIVKIDNQQEYFGVAPELKVGEKYFTTLYTSFAYELPEGIKAYYVDNHNYTNANAIAELKEIGNTVPATTPAILECTSNKVEDNILKPILPSNAPAAIKDNQLSGIYFCGYLLFGNNERTFEGYSTEWKNVTAYDDKTMRILGTDAEGNLALVPATDSQLKITNLGKYLPANKAYITINASEASATNGGIRLLSKEEYDTALSIQAIEVSKPHTGIYTLTGTRLRNGDSTEGLSKGVYILNGKKTIIK